MKIIIITIVIFAITALIYENYKRILENWKRKRDGFVFDGTWYNYKYFDYDGVNLIIKPDTCLLMECTT